MVCVTVTPELVVEFIQEPTNGFTTPLIPLFVPAFDLLFVVPLSIFPTRSFYLP